jgi:Antirestriction protein
VATAIVSQSVRSSVPYPVQSAASRPTPHASVSEIVTEQVIKQLESGIAPWRKPWRTEMPCNLVSGKPYRGINIFLLGMQGRASKYWLTFKQAQSTRRTRSRGRKSEHGDFLECRRGKTQRQNRQDVEALSIAVLLRFQRNADR